MMITVAGPLPVPVEGDHEKAFAVKLFQHRAAVIPCGYGIAQRGGEMIQHGGLQQKIADRLRLGRKHLFREVGGDIALPV